MGIQLKAFSGNSCHAGVSGWTVVVHLRTWILILACIIPGFALRAQPIFGVETGISILRYQDEREDDLSVVHPGHSYGFSLEMEVGTLHLFMGFVYQRIAVVGVGDIGLAGIFHARDNFHRVRFPACVAYPVWESHDFGLLIEGGLDIDFLFGVDDNPAGISLDRLNDILFAAHGCLRGDLGRLYLVTGYEFGITRVLGARPGSRPSGFFIKLGWQL